MSPDSWIARDVARLIHPLHNRKLHEQHGRVWQRGEGPFLFDSDGRKYIDLLSGLWNVAAGHGRRELAEAAARQMSTLGYCSGYAGSSNPAAIELAERLSTMVSPRITRFFFTSGGGEATDTCIKTARYFWRQRGRPEKSKIITRTWGYHGTTLAAMSATGIASYWPMFEPRVGGIVQIPAPDPYRYPAPGGSDLGRAAADELEQAIQREGPETVAMFFAEPVQGAGGVIVPPDSYWPRIREICTKYEVLLGADEVITGFGRTGRDFALQRWGVEPDLVQFAKAITSGYFPLGGVGFSEEIADVLDRGPAAWMHAYTYSAHPVGCAVALRNLDILRDEQLTQRAAENGPHLLQTLRARLAGHPHVGDVRGLGMMCGVEFVQDRATKAEFPASDGTGMKVLLAMLERGVYSRVRGDVLLVAPPLITPREVIDEAVAAVADAVRAVLG